MQFTVQARKKAVRRVLKGETPEEVMKDLKISKQRMSAWRRQYEAEVREKLGAEPTKTEEAPKKPKRQRRPLGTQNVLTFEGQEDPNYIYRGFVEDARRVGRVQAAMEAGWEPVPTSDGRLGQDSGMNHPSIPGSIVSRASGNGAVTYLMRKRKDEEEEDLKVYENRAKKLEEAVFGELQKDGRYGSIQIGQRKESA